MQRATWIRVQAATAGLGAGERSITCLRLALKVGLVLIDEERARRAAKTVGLNVAGSTAVLERGARLGLFDDLRSVHLNLLNQVIRYDRRLLDQSLEKLGIKKLKS